MVFSEAPAASAVNQSRTALLVTLSQLTTVIDTRAGADHAHGERRHHPDVRAHPPAGVASDCRSDKHEELAHALKTIRSPIGKSELLRRSLRVGPALSIFPELSDECRDQNGRSNSQRLCDLRDDVSRSPCTRLARSATRSPSKTNRKVGSDEHNREQRQIHYHRDRAVLGQYVLQRVSHDRER